MNYLKDEYLLKPLVKKTDVLYTVFGMTPNMITLINAFIVTGCLFYYWYIDNFIYSFIFLYLRNILDGADGYIARKYKLYSKVGDIYDHMSDCVFIGLYFHLTLNKMNLPEIYLIPICNTVIASTMVLQFSGDYDWISKNTVGAGGNYNSYCTLYYLLGHSILYFTNYYKFNLFV